MVFSLKVARTESVTGIFWNVFQHLMGVGATVLVMLRIIGVIHWSWWWVLAPLWLSGIQLAIWILGMLVIILWGLLAK